MEMTRVQIKVLQNHDALVQNAAERFVASAVDAIRAHGRFHVALSGGRTPKSLYALLATDRYAARVDWPRVHVFWGDERCVPPADPMSNYRMVRETLIDRVPLPAENVHRIRGEDDPVAAAAVYERELRHVLGTSAGPPTPDARFDLILLGMGDDGHTASLFPGLTAVGEHERWVMAQYVAAVSMWRVTCTPVLFNAAAAVVFLVSGREKAETLRQVLEGPYQPELLPAQVVAPRDGSVCWLLDAAAAANLTEAGGQ
jgi:6-phosphogluconolactonase